MAPKIEDLVPSDSTWGRNVQEFDRRASRRYLSMLSTGNRVGEALAIILAISVFWGACVMVLTLNFENAIFTDGTARACQLDGSTGEITNVQ